MFCFLSAGALSNELSCGASRRGGKAFVLNHIYIYNVGSSVDSDIIYVRDNCHILHYSWQINSLERISSAQVVSDIMIVWYLFMGGKIHQRLSRLSCRIFEIWLWRRNWEWYELMLPWRCSPGILFALRQQHISTSISRKKVAATQDIACWAESVSGVQHTVSACGRWWRVYFSLLARIRRSSDDLWACRVFEKEEELII